MKLELERILISLAENSDDNKVQPEREILQAVGLTRAHTAKLKSKTFSGSTSRTTRDLRDLEQGWHLREE